MSNSHQALPTAVQWAHELIQPRLRAGKIALDATAGNGHDTLFLARALSPTGKVFAFDIQEAAILATHQRLQDAAIPENSYQLFHDSHANLLQCIGETYHEKIDFIMFNLGYLPGADKTCITRVETTLTALQQALHCLAVDGLMTLVVYPGHEGGKEEAQQVQDLLSTLDSKQFEAQQIHYLNLRATTPRLFAVRRRKSSYANAPIEKLASAPN